MSLRTSDYDFTLPDRLIARYPLPRRQDARMLCWIAPLSASRIAASRNSRASFSPAISSS
jgi:S-adenosylmethionine:tRNA-ribosyltransferase-isomerase (queuine synthetase)